mmetsp:Transcript_59728/g.175236  ORF Transcript_59728/g.175236 Transcript_59728/m.175236 type:complete len:213 (+) Transcript_59728:904-1542(+)
MSFSTVSKSTVETTNQPPAGGSFLFASVSVGADREPASIMSSSSASIGAFRACEREPARLRTADTPPPAASCEFLPQSGGGGAFDFSGGGPEMGSSSYIPSSVLQSLSISAWPTTRTFSKKSASEPLWRPRASLYSFRHLGSCSRTIGTISFPLMTGVAVQRPRMPRMPTQRFDNSAPVAMPVAEVSKRVRRKRPLSLSGAELKRQTTTSSC